jgi:uncharacterized membrane protein
MEALTTLTFFAVVAVLIILVTNFSSLNAKFKWLLEEVNSLKHSVSRLEMQIKERGTSLSTPTREKTPVNVVASEEKPEPSIEIEQPAQSIEKISMYENTNIQEDIQQPVAPAQPIIVPESTVSAVQQPSKPPKPAKPPKQPTDFEKFIGENLISKIGIIILVLGIGFFVKYAIDQNWIGVYGRTAIGLITGGILVSLAHYLRKSFKTFSSLLTGGGFAVFYITIAIAFHQYHIFSQTMAFIIMVLITIFSVILSLAYDKKELAIFSQIGGYAAPFMLATGEGNYIVLFTYMLILNAGLITLAYFKRWHVLNLLAFIFTIILFSGWIASTFLEGTNLPYRNAMIFATAFYVVFFLVNILNNVKERKPFKAVEIMMIISNNLFFFLWGIAILYSYQKGIYKGLFTVLAGLFNFGWVLYLYKKKQVDKTLIYLLVALVMSYISLAVPIQLNGHSITLFWTAELVILLWLSQVSGIKILKSGHLLILGMVIVSLMMDWNNIYNYSSSSHTLSIVFNQAFITGVLVIAGMGISAFLLNREKESDFVKNIISTRNYKGILTLLLFLFTFVIPLLEINYQAYTAKAIYSFPIIYDNIYIYAYLFVVAWIIQNKKWNYPLKWIFGISWIALSVYFIIYHISLLDLRYFYLTKATTLSVYLIHYLTIPFIIGLVFLLNKVKHTVLSGNEVLTTLFIWFVPSLLVFIASTELDNIILLTMGATIQDSDAILEMSHKVGYPILWGIAAFILITLGIKKKDKTGRIQALCLFGLIIAKLFLFDVWSMSEGGRIAAFVFLGVVLLVVSFLYQKLKNFLLDSNENTSSEETEIQDPQ